MTTDVSDPSEAMTDRAALRLAVVSGGTGNPSSTRMLTDRLAGQVATISKQRGRAVSISVIDLRDLIPEISTALASQILGPGLTRAVELLHEADGVIAAAPVYKAAASGLFTSFFHVLDNDLLIGKPVLLAATAGTERHALVIDGQMRSLFAFLRTLTAPTAVFAADEDWNSGELGSRIERAAFELVLLMESGFADAIREHSWGRYQHEFGSAGGTELDVNLDSDLMRLATGGTAS